MQELKSIQDALKILNTNCKDCEELGFPGKYDNIEREGDLAVYKCSFLSFHELKLKANFETPKEEINKLIENLNELIKNKPKSNALEIEKYTFKNEYDSLIKRLYILVEFAPKDFQIKFNGLCYYCGREVPVEIKEREVWYNCPDCASILADSME